MQYSKPRKYEHESRYGKYRQIIDDENTWTETFNQSIIPKSNEDNYHVVSDSQRGRPDIIATMYYNDPTLYWAILLANDLIDPFMLDAGTVIRVPAKSSLYNNNGVLNTFGLFYY